MADEEYVRVGGKAICSGCGNYYEDHPRETHYDSFNGEEMHLVRSCFGQLFKT